MALLVVIAFPDFARVTVERAQLCDVGGGRLDGRGPAGRGAGGAIGCRVTITGLGL
jgi:hypothetical protein